MKNCPKCGASGDDSVKFCPICGSPMTEAAAPSAPTAPTPPPMTPPAAPNSAAAGTEAPKNSVSDVINGLNNTADTTNEYDPDDIKNNTVMSVLAYLGILVLVPILAAKESKFARFHANQGLLLLILEIASGVISWLGKIPLVGFVFSIASWIVSLAGIVLAVLGIINAANGKAKELPVIGQFRLLK